MGQKIRVKNLKKKVLKKETLQKPFVDSNELHIVSITMDFRKSKEF